MLNNFSKPTSIWFSETFETPTLVQNKGWASIALGPSALLVAPTGSGKTLAAFLWAIDRTVQLDPSAPPGVRVVYISPLKALVYDIERNLRAPLAGIQRVGQRLGQTLRDSQVDMRTGDTPAKERRTQLKRPADILVTTPESLFLLLGSKARANFATVHTVIVDEIHALAPTKRGAHLALSLERLSELTAIEPQRIGLSATVRPMEEVARFLGGAREVNVVDSGEPPKLDVEVVVPVPDLDAPRWGNGQGERGIWPAIYPSLLKIVLANRSTIIFVNSQGLCERLAQRINELAESPLVVAHHGSVSHEKRAEMEEALKQGALRGIVATSSLELGIDMGTVDTVVLIESPGSVARGLQRIGRSGHQVSGRSSGKIFPKFKGDLLECALIGQRMGDAAIEAVSVITSPLDVLAQQLVAMCCDAPRSVDALHAVVKRAFAYRELSREALTSVLDMLSGRYPSDEFADLTPRLRWDRTTDLLQARRGTAMLSRLNAGTIPDRGLYGVFLGEHGPRVGELDEEMVFETRPGERIILGASTWAVESIGRDAVVVSPAPGEPGRMPFWRGDGPGRPLELGRALGAFTHVLGLQREADLPGYIKEHTPLDALAATNLASYIIEQKQHTGTLPTDRTITVERFRDELGDWRVCILSPFGTPVHGPWAVALQNTLSARAGFEVPVMYTDDGIVVRFADTDELAPLDALFPDPNEVEELITEQLSETALFAALFRENAARSLLLPRRSASRRNPLWAQRCKAESLLAAVKKYPGFAVVLETYRQTLADVFDLVGLRTLLRQVQTREIQVHAVETPAASPFARSLVFAYVAAYLYDQDAPLAERKAHALTLDRALLGELLGPAELRRLIDPHALLAVEGTLQALAADRQARDMDELHDRLRQLGDLSTSEVAARVLGNQGAAWLDQLRREGRAISLMVAGEPRWIVAEDAGLYRDGLGCPAPPGLCAAAPSEGPPSEGPLVRLLRRYAHTHGPFQAAEPAARFGLRPAQVEPVLKLLERAGNVVQGEIRPEGTTLEWCDSEVLRALKRHTLARLRNEIAAVDASALAQFLPRWHGLGAPGTQPLLTVITQLEGLSLPWSALTGQILPARIPSFEPGQLDVLSSSGQIVWIGRGSLGPRDGRVALYRRDTLGRLHLAGKDYSPPSDAHAALLEHLSQRGASFTFELETVVRAALPNAPGREIDALLWDLVWDGQITNDTFAPLQTLNRRARSSAHPSSPRVSVHRHRGSGLASGRWSLVSNLLNPSITDTERTVARAGMLLDRYGVVCREAVLAEDILGGFTPIYRTLAAMEEAGQVRRGYFIEGLSGAQFARSGVVEKLRSSRPGLPPTALRETPPVVLGVLDPANPYGALLPWPNASETPPRAAQTGNRTTSGRGSGAESKLGPGTHPTATTEAQPRVAASAKNMRPRRVSGAWIVLVDGNPALYAGPNGRQLLTFGGVGYEDVERFGQAVEALAAKTSRHGRRSVVIEKINGIAARESPFRSALEARGYRADHRGLVQTKRYA